MKIAICDTVPESLAKIHKIVKANTNKSSSVYSFENGEDMFEVCTRRGIKFNIVIIDAAAEHIDDILDVAIDFENRVTVKTNAAPLVADTLPVTPAAEEKNDRAGNLIRQ